MGRDINWNFNHHFWSQLRMEASNAHYVVKRIALVAFMLSCLFFLSLTILGFLFYSEMDSDAECAKITLSWSIIEVFKALVGCALCAWLVARAMNCSLGSVVPVVCRHPCSCSVAFGIITGVGDCDSALDGGSSFASLHSLGVNAWMLSGSVSHLVVYGCVLCGTRLMNTCESVALMNTVVLVLAAWMFFTAWTVIGFFLYSEMENDASCSRMALAWSVIEAAEVFSLLVAAVFMWYACHTMGRVREPLPDHGMRGRRYARP